MERQNLLGGPPPTYLLPDEEAAAALQAGEAPEQVAARFPTYSAAWAALAAAAFARGDAVTAYAYARTGYHRGLDQLRRAGWKGTARSRGSTSRTAASCARCTCWPPRPRPSARTTRPGAASSSCGRAAPPPRLSWPPSVRLGIRSRAC